MRSMLLVLSVLIWAFYTLLIYIPIILPFEIVDRVVWGTPIGRCPRILWAGLVVSAVDATCELMEETK